MPENGSRLAAEFRAHTPRAADRDEDAGALERLLVGAFEEGRAAWPGVTLDSVAYARHLARHRHGDDAPERWLAALRVTDLYLACACIEEAPGAVEAFERAYIPLIDAYLLRGGTAHDALDEVRQRVREKLLVGARKIADYSGRGALTKWLQVVALRITIDLARERHDLSPNESTESAGGVTPDPELDYLKEQYRPQFKAAFRQAIAALEVEQRNLLRLHFADGLTLEQLSAMFEMHRATVARHLAAAREAILDHARAQLERQLGISADEVDSLLRLVRSRLDLSLSAWLRADGAALPQK